MIYPLFPPFKHEIASIFLSILSLNMCFGAQINRLIGTVLLSTHNKFWWRKQINKFLIRSYQETLLFVMEGVLPSIVNKPVTTSSATIERYISQPSAICMNNAPANMLTFKKTEYKKLKLMRQIIEYNYYITL